jgi:ribosomal-protein-alanine N-acetyltransferase
MSGRVRRAAPADAPALRALQTYLDSPAPALLDAALSDALGELLVAVADAPVGYLLAVDGGPPALSATTSPLGVVSGLDVDGPTVHVAELVVAPAARRRGHASSLLARLLGERPRATVTLTVAPDNTAARSLYDRFGFERRRTIPDLFDDGPGLLLVRRPGAE